MTDQSLNDIYNKLYNQRSFIIKVVGLVFLASVIISLLYPNLFKATTVFYPASDDLSRPDVIFGLSQERTYFYGGKQERDRILSVGKSEQLFLALTNQYDFYEHYGVEQDSENSLSKVEKKFRKNFEITRNDLDALELAFVDEDPEAAALIANLSRSVLDSLTKEIVKTSLRSFVTSLDAKVTNTRHEFNDLNDSINNLRNNFQLYDTRNQISQITESITNAKIKVAGEKARLDLYSKSKFARRDTIQNIRVRIAGLEQQISVFEQGDSTVNTGMEIKELVKVGPILETLEGYFYTLKGQIALDDVLLNKLKSALKSPTSTIHIIDLANTPKEKFKPKRSLIVLVSTLAAFLFVVLGLIMFDQIKNEAAFRLK